MEESFKVRYKLLKGKRVPLCDYKRCENKAYKEIYPGWSGKKVKLNAGWCYLCRKHFKQEQKRLKNKLAYCSVED